MDESKPLILIAEDEIDERFILTESFAHLGYPVLAAADGDEALRLAQEHPVDVALVDVRMPGLSGLELTRQLRQLNPQMLIAVMSAYSTAEDAMTARESGAVYYLPKPCRPSLVIRMVEEMWATYLHGCREQVGECVVDWHLEAVIVDGKLASLKLLTERERDVLDGLAAGKSDRQIATDLGVRLTSVRTHIRNVMRKFGFKNRTQAALFWRTYRQKNPR